jgi:type I restriction enzyme, S subunit
METKNDELPQAWIVAPLGDVCKIFDSMRIPINAKERSKRIIGKSVEQLYPYYGATGQVGVIDDYIFDGEYVLLGEDGAPFLQPFAAKAYLATGRYWVNNHAHILKSQISNRYLCYFLNQIGYSAHVTGTTRLKLTQAALKNIPVNLAPENEQHRIVAKIEESFSEVDSGIESLKTAREQLKAYRHALLKHAFDGKLTMQWREQHKDELDAADNILALIANERILLDAERKRRGKQDAVKLPMPLDERDRAKLPALPVGWSWVRLGELFSTSPRNGIYKPSTEYGAGTTIIRIDDFYDGKLIRKSGFKRVKLTEYEIEQYTVRGSEILINRVNSPEYLGKCALLSGLTEPTVFESNMMKLSLTSFVSEAYVTMYLASHEGRMRLCTNAKHAVNQASINQTDVANAPVPLPSLLEQEHVVALLEQKLSESDALIEEIEIYLNKAEALRQSILKRAFSGKLASQDSNDEPASALLERIRADKADKENGKKEKR